MRYSSGTSTNRWANRSHHSAFRQPNGLRPKVSAPTMHEEALPALAVMAGFLGCFAACQTFFEGAEPPEAAIACLDRHLAEARKFFVSPALPYVALKGARSRRQNRCCALSQCRWLCLNMRTRSLVRQINDLQSSATTRPRLSIHQPEASDWIQDETNRPVP